jgi:hypothetical protein
MPTIKGGFNLKTDGKKVADTIFKEIEDIEEPTETVETEVIEELSLFDECDGVCPNCGNEKRNGKSYKSEQSFNDHVAECE